MASASNSFACSPPRGDGDPSATAITAAARSRYADAALVADVRVESFYIRTGKIVYRLLHAWKGDAPVTFLVVSPPGGVDDPVEGATYRELFRWSDDGFDLVVPIQSVCGRDRYDRALDAIVGPRRPASYRSMALPLPPAVAGCE